MKYTLNNGIEIPKIGFGTWQIPDGEVAYNAVTTALEAGYRHIDTATIYHNEESVGKAILDSHIPREDLFVTTKLWTTDRGYDNAFTAFEQSLERLGLDYVDLYLIHWPANPNHGDNWNEINQETWKALEELNQQNKVKSIGLSNFMPKHIEGILDICTIKPVVNQIEFHPGYVQKETVEYCKTHNILIEGWSPIGSGALLDHPTLLSIADKYQVSVAQLCIIFALQSGHIPLPKSTTPKNITSNLIKKYEDLSEEDFSTILNLPEAGFSGLKPDEVEF